MRRSSTLRLRRGLRPALVLAALLTAGPAAAIDIVVDGPETILFDQATEACDGSDLPDAPARAFRNAAGEIVLFAPNFKNRALVGPDLAHLKRDCTVRFAASGNPDPALLDDRSWLHAFYTDDGVSIFAFASASFIPYRHGIACEAGKVRTDCWRNGIAALQSSDSGNTFHYLGTPPEQVAFPPPEPYRSHIVDPPGFISATNIVRWQGSLYTVLWQRGDEEEPSRNCLARASANNPLAWEVWSGDAFIPATHFDGRQWIAATTSCAAIDIAGQPVIRGIVFHEASETFIAVFQKRTKAASGFFYATSRDLIAWSEPLLLIDLDLRSDTGGVRPWVAYPSLIDETSADRNFGTIGESAALLYVRVLPRPGRATVRQVVALPLRVVHSNATEPNLRSGLE
jgi:hypothetical protein